MKLIDRRKFKRKIIPLIRIRGRRIKPNFSQNEYDIVYQYPSIRQVLVRRNRYDRITVTHNITRKDDMRNLISSYTSYCIKNKKTPINKFNKTRLKQNPNISKTYIRNINYVYDRRASHNFSPVRQI